MEIDFSPGLEDLVCNVKEKCLEGLYEREKLGLEVPDDFRIYIKWGDNVFQKASFKIVKDKRYVFLNVLGNLFYGQKEKYKKEKKVVEFFTRARLLSQDDFSVFALKVMENPKKLTEFELEEKKLAKHKRFFKSQRKYLKNNAESALEAFLDIKDEAKDIFLHGDYDVSIRHELSHADFSYGIYPIKFTSDMIRFYDLERKYFFLRKEEYFKELKKLSLDLLETEAIMLSCEEERAIFFNFIKADKWDSFNTVAASKKVGKFFVDFFVNSSYQNMIRAQVSYKMRKQSDIGLFSKIKEMKKVSEFSDSFRKVAYHVADVLSDAYKNNRSFINDLKRAKDHDEFMSMFY